MELRLLDEQFSVCKIKDISGVDFQQKFLFLSITDDEISLVCSTENLPENTCAAEHNWRALKIAGVLDFSLVGILAKISTILAESGISIFAVSTYNTDYILLKADKLAEASRVLTNNGYYLV